MTAVEVGKGTGGNDRVNIRDIIRLAQAREVAADNYACGSESGAATTFTVTFVYTPASGSITANYAST